MKPNPKLIALVKDSSDTIWQIWDQVYRVTSRAEELARELDEFGCPMSRRWESSIEHFNLYAKRGDLPHLQILSLDAKEPTTGGAWSLISSRTVI
jgi:hypothetical protein